MFGQKQLTELRVRKDLLRLQAEAHRQLLAVDSQAVANSLRWLEPIHRGWQQVKEFSWLAAPLGGLCLAKRGRSVWRGVVRCAKAWSWIRAAR